MNTASSNFLREVAAFYDRKKNDFNLLLAPDSYVHHHNGLCTEDAVFPEMTEEALLQELHRQETQLTKRGLRYLEGVTPEMCGLDAGCGRGGSSLLMHEQFRCRLDAITLSPYQARFTREAVSAKGAAERIQVHCGNMLALPFENGRFDFIWACESTEHVPELRGMFEEFGRVTRRGGRLVIIAWCGDPTHPQGALHIEQVNAAYKTTLHPLEHYIAAARPGWTLDTIEDLTAETVPYWRLRSRSVHRTGVESFMYEGYRSRALTYQLFAFRRE